MITCREIALEQALIAIIGAGFASNLDVDSLIDEAVIELRGNAGYFWVDHPHVANAIQVMRGAQALACKLGL